LLGASLTRQARQIDKRGENWTRIATISHIGSYPVYIQISIETRNEILKKKQCPLHEYEEAATEKLND